MANQTDGTHDNARYRRRNETSTIMAQQQGEKRKKTTKERNDFVYPSCSTQDIDYSEATNLKTTTTATTTTITSRKMTMAAMKSAVSLPTKSLQMFLNRCSPDGA